VLGSIASHRIFSAPPSLVCNMQESLEGARKELP
jgi:hypothetical protein